MRVACVVLLLAGLLQAGCNPLLAVAESPTLGGRARDALAATCCACLVDARADGVEADDACPGPDGGGEVDEGDGVACLCGAVDYETCSTQLRGGQPIVVLGACVRRGGGGAAPCDDACGGVLSFPDEGTAPSP